MPFDDKKHPRDTGKFSKIPGGKSDAKDDVRAQIKSTVMAGTGAIPQPMRDPDQLRQAGVAAARGYDSAMKATTALHASGDVQALHHHGRALQDAVKNLKVGGAKPEELEKLRHGLSALHSALSQGDSVAAHEALTSMQHGFYRAHSMMRQEHGMGGFPPIGQSTGTPGAGMAEKAVEFGKKKMGELREGAGRAADALWSAPKAVGDAAKRIFSPNKPKWQSIKEFKAAVDEIAARFGLDDLPEKPSPEDFDRAVKLAENIKIGKWDHRHIDMDRLLPSENKDAPDGLVDQIKKDPNAAPPIVVKPHGDDYNILDGHTRYAAHRKAGSKGMWAVVVKDGDYMRDDVQKPVVVNVNVGDAGGKFVATDRTIRMTDAPRSRFQEAMAEMFESQEDVVKTEVQRAMANIVDAKGRIIINNQVAPTPVTVQNEVKVSPTPVTVQNEVKVEPTPVEIKVLPTPVQTNVNVDVKDLKVIAEVKLPERKPLDVEFKTDKDGRLTGMKGK